MRSAWVWLGFDWHWAFVLGCALVLTGAGWLVSLAIDYWRDVTAEPEFADPRGDDLYVYEAGDEFEPEFDDWTDDQLAVLHDLPAPPGMPASRGGEFHYMDTWLGHPGDGSEHTALRVRREQQRMLARYEAEQAAHWAAMGMTGPWRGLAVAA
jgi:hypothetical protein